MAAGVDGISQVLDTLQVPVCPFPSPIPPLVNDTHLSIYCTHKYANMCVIDAGLNAGLNILFYPMTNGFLRGECGIKDFKNLQCSVTVGSVKVGRVWASLAAFGNPWCTFVPRDYDIWKSRREKNTQCTMDSGGWSWPGLVAYFLILA